jgi:murein DD-endopeptidase MepM/ murein hydrolase activator NlpD
MPVVGTRSASFVALAAALIFASPLARADEGEEIGINLVHVPLDASRASPRMDALWNPMPGGHLAGYAIDTGLDIGGFKMPVYAIAPGIIEYAETGHTRWTGKGDSPWAVRLALDTPIPWKKRHITHVWYAHLTSVEFAQPEEARERSHVEGGQRLGVSGFANGAPHLHLGMLLDGDVSQDWGSYLLEDEIRAVLGNLPAKGKLAKR